jgi:hypothetical protein
MLMFSIPAESALEWIIGTAAIVRKLDGKPGPGSGAHAELLCVFESLLSSRDSNPDAWMRVASIAGRRKHQTLFSGARVFGGSHIRSERWTTASKCSMSQS